MSDLNRAKSLLSSQARIQVPWVKVTIGDYTFGIFDSKTKSKGAKDKNGFYSTYQVKYPDYIQSLTVTKISAGNGHLPSARSRSMLSTNFGD